MVARCRGGKSRDFEIAKGEKMSMINTLQARHIPRECVNVRYHGTSQEFAWIVEILDPSSQKIIPDSEIVDRFESEEEAVGFATRVAENRGLSIECGWRLLRPPQT